MIQFLLLCCVLIFSVIYDPAAHPHGLTAVIAAMIAVSTVACQFALLRLAVPGTPSTAVMTGNLTNATPSLLDSLAGSQALTKGAQEGLDKTWKLLLGLFAGCVAGAAAVSLLGSWAWSLPVVLAAAAVQVPQRREKRVRRKTAPAVGASREPEAGSARPRFTVSGSTSMEAE